MTPEQEIEDSIRYLVDAALRERGTKIGYADADRFSWLRYQGARDWAADFARRPGIDMTMSPPDMLDGWTVVVRVDLPPSRFASVRGPAVSQES